MAEGRPVLESEVFITSLDEQGFVKTVVKTGAEIKLQQAVENSSMVKTVSGQKKLPLLVDLRNLLSITKEARDYFSMRDREPSVTSIALLIDSPIGSVIGNFYILISKPVVPTQLFTNEQHAISWLIKYVKSE